MCISCVHRALPHDVYVLEALVLQAVGVVLQPNVGVHLAGVPLEVGEQPRDLRGVGSNTQDAGGNRCREEGIYIGIRGADYQIAVLGGCACCPNGVAASIAASDLAMAWPYPPR